MLEKTLEGNTKVRLNLQYPVVAGVDEGAVPQLLQVDQDGALKTSRIAGFAIGSYDRIDLSYVGTTNNLAQAVYYKEGVILGTITLTYAGGGVADNDLLIRAART